MRQFKSIAAAALATSLVGWTAGLGGLAFADDPTPPPAAAGAGGGRHHNPAWAACKQKADDQKLERGEARRQFMQDCLKSAPAVPPPPST
jgi:hypothetical protein